MWCLPLDLEFYYFSVFSLCFEIVIAVGKEMIEFGRLSFLGSRLRARLKLSFLGTRLRARLV